MEEKKGIIYQSIAGFYYIWSEGTTYSTKPKGLFRHTKEKPLVGDWVIFEYDHNNSESESRIIEILPRKNHLIRPNIVNVDRGIIVISLIEPDFSFSLLDFFLINVESYQIDSIIVLSKLDLLIEAKGQETSHTLVSEITDIYSKIGYSIIVANGTDDVAKEVAKEIEEGVYVVMGQSGVGKSTLLNNLIPEINIETNEISESLNRGKHTTREVTLYPYKHALIADTPGFSSLDFSNVAKDELRFLFPEINEHSVNCQFRTCIHINEPKCGVKEAVESGEISLHRYDSYRNIYEKISSRKPKY